MTIPTATQDVGRYIVDIDGCLRATNARCLTVGQIIALHGRLDPDAAIVWESNGERIPLSTRDRIELSEDRVAFFRSCAGPRLFRSCAGNAMVAARWGQGRTATPAMLAL